MTSGPHDWHYVVNPPLGGFLTGKGKWQPDPDEALWQPTAGGAYWAGIVGEFGVQFRVVIASALGQGVDDFHYDDPGSLYDTARYSTSDVTWFDITPRVRDFNVNRGKNHLGEQFRPGSASVLLSNEDGVFNPQRGQVTIGGQALRPGRVIGFQGKETTSNDWTTLWVGRIDSLGDVYKDAAHDVLSSWTCTGFMTLLQQDAPPPLEAVDPATVGQLTGARVRYIWDLAGYNPDYLVEDTGRFTLQGTQFPGSRLAQMLSASVADGGDFFEDRDGVLNFKQGGWLLDPPTKPLLFIGQASSDIKVLQARTSWDGVRIRNQVSMQATGGVTQSQINSTSIATYGPHNFSRAGLENDQDTDVVTLVDEAIDFNAFDTLRIDNIDVWASKQETILPMLEIEIGDQVQVQILTAFGWNYTIVAWVMGVSHTVTHSDWKINLRLDNTDRSNPSQQGAFSNAHSSAFYRKV